MNWPESAAFSLYIQGSILRFILRTFEYSSNLDSKRLTIDVIIIFQMMIQPQNRKMSFSLYISAVAVADTMVAISGK